MARPIRPQPTIPSVLEWTSCPQAIDQPPSRSNVCPDATCRAIARRLGFESEFYFSRRFKQLAGTSPSDYRQRASTISIREGD